MLPDILWITTDQQRYDTLGCTGNPFVHTPNLDRLVRPLAFTADPLPERRAHY